MIGCSSPMQQVYDLVRRVANLNASVLIAGRKRHGQRTDRQAHPQPRLSGRSAVCGCLLRRHPRNSDRSRVVRPRERRLHRHGRHRGKAIWNKPATVRSFSMKSARLSSEHAGEAAAGAAAARIQPAGQQPAYPFARPSDFRNPSGPGGNGGSKANSARISTTASM